ncbi:YciI family protein [Frankia sp. Cppng1_Ct_nod]|uniref:YciI family protein n=1 Tax=Frankia sp. Cppng1_Ct_nod TaxID=2897162 RepID=UPI001041B8CC|nr:YciI family protein [Frankia sp. Cppng1_Ct_nod]
MADLNRYELVVLRQGRPHPARGEDADYDRRQVEHLQYLESLRAGGSLVLYGGSDEPDTALRAALLFRTGSLDEARAAAEADPLVQAGYLAIEVVPFVSGFRAPERSLRSVDQ